MKLLLKRIALKDNYTIGKLYIDGKYFCDTLEDAVRDVKIKHQTAIPKGIYKVTLTASPRFKRILPRLHDVPEFTGVLIHRGNTIDDTSGCILVGENKKKGMVLNSTKYEVELVTILTKSNSKNITIEII